MADDIPFIWPLVGASRYEVIREHVKDYGLLPNTSRVDLKHAWIDR
jgi:hypothetical protein